MPPDRQHQPPFPVQSAFVVQLHREAQVAAGRVMGRVEHIESRQASTFDSVEALLAFMDQVLVQDDDVDEATSRPHRRHL